MSDPAAVEPVVDETLEMEVEEESAAIEPNQLVWGVSATTMVLYSFMMRKWYKSDIEADNVTFPDADGTGTDFSEEWALETREVTAWADAYTWNMRLYGLGWLAWALNISLGSNGNIYHKAFHYVVKALPVAPVLSLYHALKIQRQYLPNSDVYNYVPYARLYLYDPEEVDETAYNYLDFDAYYTRIFALYLLTAVSFGAMASSM